MTASRYPLADALARLAVPGASEVWSALAGACCLVVEARAGESPGRDGGARRALAALRTLPCPTILLTPAVAAPAPWHDAFDVVASAESDVDALTAGIARAPIAAATLVQTLRATAALAIPDALTVESLAYSTLQAGPEHAAWAAARGPIAARPTDDGPAVVIAEDGDTLLVTLSRPARHNAYSARMRDELVAALDVAVADPRRRVVLRGAGPSFCSGGDLDEFGTRPDPATAHLVRTMRSAGRRLADIAARVRVEVHGACMGAGVELAAFAGIVVAERDAFFQLPEIAMGLVPGAGGTVSLPRRIGRQRAAALALSGRRLDAETARAWGLVDALVRTSPR